MKKALKIISLALATVLILTCFAGCGSKDKGVGTINGKAIPTDLLKFTLSDMINNVEASYGVSFDEVANEQLTEEMTVYQYIASYSLSVVQQALAVDSYFDELGLEWNDEAQASCDTLIENYYSGNGGEDAVKADFKERGIEVSALEALMKFNTKHSMIAKHLYGDNGAKAITDAEIEAKFHEDYRRVKHILVATVDTATYQPFEGDELAAAEAKYAEVEAKVKALKTGDEEGFVALMNEYNEDPGMTQMLDGYVLSKNSSYVQAFIDGAFAVGEGEYAFETSEEYGHHILMRLPTRETDIITEFGSVAAYVENYRSVLLSNDIAEITVGDKIDIDDTALQTLVSQLI